MAEDILDQMDSELLKRIGDMARAEGKSTDQFVGELVSKYSRDIKTAAYVDDLWNRVGTRLASLGVTQKRVRSVIREVRSGNR